MKKTMPPLQRIRVGLEPNQHGQAALQEHASSRLPETFQGAFFASAARAGGRGIRKPRTTRIHNRLGIRKSTSSESDTPPKIPIGGARRANRFRVGSAERLRLNAGGGSQRLSPMSTAGAGSSGAEAGVFVYFSHLLSRRIVDAQSAEIGRLWDLSIRLPEPYPLVRQLWIRPRGQTDL